MKLAGQKNQGAWMRARKDLSQVAATVREQLSAELLDLDTIQPAFGALTDYAAQFGIQLEGQSQTLGEWAAKLAAGEFSLQIWMGRLTTTTYTEDPGPPRRWVANYQSQIHFFAVDLRSTVKRFLVADHEVKNTLVLKPYTPRVPVTGQQQPAAAPALKAPEIRGKDASSGRSLPETKGPPSRTRPGGRSPRA